MGIRNKLVLCLLAVLLPVVAVGMFATHLVDRQMAERIGSALANSQRLEVARIEQSLQNYASHARGLASGPHVRKFVSDIHRYRYAGLSESDKQKLVIGAQDEFAIVDPLSEWPLQQLALALQRKAGIVGSSVVEIRIVDRTGKTLGESLDFSWTPADESQVDRSMRNVKTSFGEAFKNTKNQNRLGMVSPIISADGTVVGALVMEARLEPIISMISKHESMGDSMEAHIAQPTIDGDAQFITALRFDKSAAFNRTVPQSKNKVINQSLNSPDSQVIRSTDYRGVDSFMAFQTVPTTGWGLVVKVDAEEIYAPADKLRNWLMWATAASIGFVAIIYMFFFVPVARRLKRAANAARHIAAGNLSARLVDSSGDEISELASSINILAEDLAEDQQMRAEIEARLRHQAIHDELTGLLNRKHANTILEELSLNPEKVHSLVFLDLNGFKDVNDLYGHAAGDEVLRCVAQRLAKPIPQGSTLARWGGDEFVIVMPNTSEKKASQFALALHDLFGRPMTSSKGKHNITCSIGLATSSSEKTLEDALLDADALMYEHKNQQNPHKSKGGSATRNAEKALLENRMELWFQPILHIEHPGNYVLVGAGTQVKTRNPQGDYSLVEQFEPNLKDESVIRAIDERVIDLSLSALKRWNAAGIVDSHFQLCISLSQAALRDRRLPAEVLGKLESLGIARTQIQLEVPVVDFSFDNSILANLNEVGIPIALNGQGNEPNLLRYLPLTAPSQTIIGKPCEHDNLVLPHLIESCKKLGVSVLAREVNSRDELARLHAIGVTQFQGSVFEQPLRAVDFVSRWGQTQLTGLGRVMTQKAGLRLVG